MSQVLLDNQRKFFACRGTGIRIVSCLEGFFFYRCNLYAGKTGVSCRIQTNGQNTPIIIRCHGKKVLSLPIAECTNDISLSQMKKISDAADGQLVFSDRLPAEEIKVDLNKLPCSPRKIEIKKRVGNRCTVPQYGCRKCNRVCHTVTSDI